MLVNGFEKGEQILILLVLSAPSIGMPVSHNIPKILLEFLSFILSAFSCCSIYISGILNRIIEN